MPSATFYLALKAINRHPYMAARLTARGPALQPGEVALELTVDVPAAMFKRPALRAQVTVPEGSQAPVITPQVQQGIADAVRAQLGVAVHITAEPET